MQYTMFGENEMLECMERVSVKLYSFLRILNWPVKARMNLHEGFKASSREQAVAINAWGLDDDIWRSGN